MQTTSNILMIRPVAFGFNDQTAGSNYFQQKDTNDRNVQQKALQEFDSFVNLLQENGVNVTVIDDTRNPHTPDSIFPNNWVSFHDDGEVFLYPMQAENRRLERREDILQQIKKRFTVNRVTDLSSFELEGKFLEGTGSMVLDRENKIAYACLSRRTDSEVLQMFCRSSGYEPLVFKAVDANRLAIYHTNVMMALARKYAVICLESITDNEELKKVTDSLRSTGKEVVAISFEQMERFAGNMLEINNVRGESLIVMSKSAWDSLDEKQRKVILGYSKPVVADINTIETIGGGSARCMIAEIHLPVTASK